MITVKQTAPLGAKSFTREEIEGNESSNLGGAFFVDEVNRLFVVIYDTKFTPRLTEIFDGLFMDMQVRPDGRLTRVTDEGVTITLTPRLED